MSRRTAPVAALLALATLFSMVIVAAAAAAPGVTPSTVTDTMLPGESETITKSVETSPIPPNPDIFFLADSTGSMGGAIDNVQTQRHKRHERRRRRAAHRTVRGR